MEETNSLNENEIVNEIIENETTNETIVNEIEENTNQNIVENVIVEDYKKPDTVYDVAYEIHNILSVLTFLIIIIFLYRYLRGIFKIRKE